MLSLDKTTTPPLVQAPTSVAARFVTGSPDTMPPIPSADAAGMVFLRRNETHWLVAFMGIKGLSPTPLPLPFARDDSLRDVLAHLGKTYNGQLRGAWLLVAP